MTAGWPRAGTARETSWPIPRASPMGSSRWPTTCTPWASSSVSTRTPARRRARTCPGATATRRRTPPRWRPGGSTALEYRTEFSLWAEMAAPLVASTNIATLSSRALAIYENSRVIAVDQDPLGAQGVPIARAGGRWVLTKQLQNGDRSVVLFNSTNTATKIATTAAAAGLPAARAYRLQDLWTNAVS